MWHLEPIPSALRQSPLGNLDRLFARALMASAAGGAMMLILLTLVPERTTIYTSIEELPERLARLIVEPERAPAPTPVAPPAVAAAAPAPGPAAAPPRPEPAAPRRVRDSAGAAGSPAAPAPGGERGRRRAAQVAAALQAPGMLSSIDSMLDAMRSVTPSPGAAPAGSGAGRRSGPMADARRRARDLAAAAAGESGMQEFEDAAASAGSRIGVALLAPASVGVEDLAPVGSGGTAAPPGRTPEALMAVVHRYAGGIKHCYDQRLQSSPELRGRLLLLLTVAPGGAVTRLRVIGSTVRDPDLESCVLGQVRAWRFPRSPGPAVSFRCPLVFTPPAA